MGYTDLDRKINGTIAGRSAEAELSGSFDQNAVPYQYAGDYDSETRVQFPFESQWIQITSTSDTVVKYAFAKGGTSRANHGAVAAGTTSPILHVKASEIYVFENAAITVGMSSIPSGSNLYSVDERY